jgi:hypothetical protein
MRDAMSVMRCTAVELERTIYVVAGLPTALRASFGKVGRDVACTDVRKAFAWRYLRPEQPLEGPCGQGA